MSNDKEESHERMIVAQLGARMHYAVPEILEQNQMLERLYTDVYVKKSILSNRLKKGFWPNSFQKWLGRHSSILPSRKVTAFPGFGFWYFMKLRNAATQDDMYKTYLEGGTKFNQRIIQSLRKHDISYSSIYAWNTTALELFRAYKGKKKLILEQCIVPFRKEQALLCLEAKRFPEWMSRPVGTKIAQAYMEREENELELADLILSPSDFVTRGILEIEPKWASKIRQVPYGVKAGSNSNTSGGHDGLLRVLTVGKVNLRKGIPYVIEAAKKLKGKAVFRIVGDYSDLSPGVLQWCRQHAELMGSIPRNEVSAHYQWADIFLLPSVCEGSATVTYEAMQYHLPLIVTPGTGALIKHGYGGLLVRPGYSEDIVEALKSCLEEPGFLSNLKGHVKEIQRHASLDAYAGRLIKAISS